MSIFILNDDINFPEIENANEDGLLAIGGDLSIERLKNAYGLGIFPWYSEGQPILWWSPDPRFVLFPNKVHVSKRMKSILNKNNWEFRINTSFEDVIKYCQQIPRKGQDGTWIVEEMKSAYCALNEVQIAISFEVFEEEELIGGLYGIKCEKYFAGESMFSLKSNASKYALIRACEYLLNVGIVLFDCQIHSEHLESMGAEFISRTEFKKYLTC